MLFILFLRRISCLLLLLLLLLLLSWIFPYLICRHVCGFNTYRHETEISKKYLYLHHVLFWRHKTLLKQKLHIFIEYLLLYYYLRTVGCVALVSIPPQNFARPFCCSLYGIEGFGARDVTFKLNSVKNRSAGSATEMGKADTFVTWCSYMPVFFFSFFT